MHSLIVAFLAFEDADAVRLASLLDTALKDAEDPSFDTMPAGIVAPHIDYPRGWMNYAAVWGRTRVADRPDRVVILGTNHFGFSTGVTGCDKGFASPFGLCPLDERLAGALRSRLGDALYEHRFDHEREHSIELQIPWIQHCLGAGDDGSYVKVFAALIHDPCVNEGKPYDNKGVGIDEFVGAMKDALASLPGRTLVVSSADLSHAGPAFGDPQALAGEEEPAVSARNRIISHDREMLGLFEQGKIDDLIGSMTWHQNPTRWCSTGNMVAALQVTGATTLNGTPTFTINNGTGSNLVQGLHLSGQVTGTASILKNGGGTLVLRPAAGAVEPLERRSAAPHLRPR